MIPFKLFGESFSIPEKWEEITTEQFLAIRAMPVSEDLPKLMSILTGMDLEKWENALLKDEDIALLYEAIKWMNDFNLNDLPLPDKITIGEKSVPVPKNLEVLPLASKQYFEQNVLPLCKIIEDEEGLKYFKGIEPEAIPFALSAYLYKPYTGELKFSASKIGEVKDLIGKCKITESFPVAAFFLSKYLFSANERRKKFSIRTTMTTKEPALERLDNLAK